MLLARIPITLFIGVALAMTASCGISQGREQASRVAERYFSAMQQGDISNAMSLYSDHFFRVTAREAWRNTLDDMHSRCGVPQSHSLVKWNVMNMFGTNSGTRATLVYNVQYSSCKALESLTIFIPRGKEGKIDLHTLKRDPSVPASPEATIPS